MFDYRALYEIQLQVSVDFLRVMQFGNKKIIFAERGTVAPKVSKYQIKA